MVRGGPKRPTANHESCSKNQKAHRGEPRPGIRTTLAARHVADFPLGIWCREPSRHPRAGPVSQVPVDAGAYQIITNANALLSACSTYGAHRPPVTRRARPRTTLSPKIGTAGTKPWSMPKTSEVTTIAAKGRK